MFPFSINEPRSHLRANIYKRMMENEMEITMEATAVYWGSIYIYNTRSPDNIHGQIQPTLSAGAV